MRTERLAKVPMGAGAIEWMSRQWDPRSSRPLGNRVTPVPICLASFGPMSSRKRPILRRSENGRSERENLRSRSRARKQRLTSTELMVSDPFGSWVTSLGYARVSTLDQDPDLQPDALKAAGCFRVFTDKSSGTLDARTGTRQSSRPGPAGRHAGCLAKMDLLSRSLRHHIETVTVHCGAQDLVPVADREHRHHDRQRQAVVPPLRLTRRVRTRPHLRPHNGRAQAARARGRIGGRPRALTPDKLTSPRP